MQKRRPATALPTAGLVTAEPIASRGLHSSVQLRGWGS